MATTATVAVASAGAAKLHDSVGCRFSAAIYNAGPGTVYVGGADVTSTTGIPLGGGGYLTQDVGETEDLYGITSSGEGATVRVMASQSHTGTVVGSVATGSPGVVGGSGVSSILRVTATGDILAFTGYLRGVSLTAGSDAATAVVRAGGAAGTIILTMKAATSTTVSVQIGNVQCASGIHVTLTGTSPESSVVYSI